MNKQTKDTTEVNQAGKKRTFTEVESPNFFRFENIGDSIEGTYKAFDRSAQFGFGMYTLEQDDGSPVRFHGSADLDDKMLCVKIGDYVKVTYTETKKRPKGTMNIFNVQVSRA